MSELSDVFNIISDKAKDKNISVKQQEPLLNKDEQQVRQKLDNIEITKGDKPVGTIFTPKERDEFTNKVLKEQDKKHKLRRSEKKMIKNQEYDATSGRLREIVIGLTVIGMIFVVIIRSVLPNQAMFALLIIIGATSFLPIGMILGWMLFDPFMRCKIMRKMSKRNYGIVNFVGHGGKLFPKIKNFDYSLIWKNNECWVLQKSRVFQVTKDGNSINTGKQIDMDNIVTIVDTVPVLFVDMHSMEPLSLSIKDNIAIYPSEIGSSLKGWVDNQRAKLLATKKMEDVVMIIVLVCCVGAIAVSFMTMTKVEEMAETMDAMQSQLQNLASTLQQNPP